MTSPASGPLPAPLALLLTPLGWLYRLAVVSRAALYRRGLLTTRRLGVTVVSVGNLAVGGAGKTPVVEYLARSAAAVGLRPVVISRGYGRSGRSRLLRACAEEGVPADAAALGDEPLWLTVRNPGLPVYVSRYRHEAGRLAETIDAPGLIVLDDAFQHLALARELNLVLVDAERGLGNGRLLPRGYLREPLSALARADAVVIAKANLGDGAALRRELAPWLARPAAGMGPIPIFSFDYRPSRLLRLDGGAERPPESLSGRCASLVCAIARPQGFVATVESLGARVERLLARRDHDPYAPSTLAELDAALLRAGADSGTDGAGSPETVWVTTEKDAVKLRERLPNPERMWVLEMEVRPEAGWDEFLDEFLQRALRADAGRPA